MNFFVIKKQTVLLIFLVFITAVSFSVWYMLKAADTVVFNQENSNIREIHLVTGEYKTKLSNGKEIEAYRWDPGTISIEKNEKVRLVIYGVNGESHPFHIEGTTIKGTIKKGQETVIPLKFKKEGTYRLICHAHPDKDHNGPMIAYIVVD
jgi:heme/copper-type cytochrome/quinol oxidase subunit 2